MWLSEQLQNGSWKVTQWFTASFESVQLLLKMALWHLKKKPICAPPRLVSVSAQDDIIVLGKAHMHSAASIGSLAEVALEPVPIIVWLNTGCFWPRRVERQWLPFCSALSFMWSMLWCCGLSMFRKFLKPLSTSAVQSCKLDEVSAVLASLSAGSCSLTLTWPGQ